MLGVYLKNEFIYKVIFKVFCINFRMYKLILFKGEVLDIGKILGKGEYWLNLSMWMYF